MKKYLLATTALALLPALTVPADANSFTWTGFYIGVQGGGVRNNVGLSGAVSDAIRTSEAWTVDQSWTSGLFGGFAGYDYQFGPVVIGIEGDLNARFGRHDSFLPPAFGINLTTGWTSESTWDASIRGRFGVVLANQFLVYVTGGWAFSNFTFANPGAATPGAIYWGTANVYGGDRSGWTIGGGTQFAVNRNWSARFEYRHTDYGTVTGTATFDIGKGPGPASFQSKITDDRFTGGLAYKF